MKKVTVKFNFSSIIWGIILVAAGVIFALNALEITNIDVFFKGWWTLFIIIPCAVNLVSERDDIMGNLFGIALGVFLLLCARDVLDYSIIWKLLLPVFVVALGLKLLIKGIFGRKYKDFDDEDDDEDDENDAESDGFDTSNVIFSSHRISYDSKEFRFAELNVVFGGATLDLRNAVIEGDCKVRIHCVFGGATVFVPENVNVKVNGSGVFGGVSDKTDHRECAPTVYIKSDFVFGGITVK